MNKFYTSLTFLLVVYLSTGISFGQTCSPTAPVCVPANGYAFQYAADTDFGLKFNAVTGEYQFTDMSGAGLVNINAVNGRLTVKNNMLVEKKFGVGAANPLAVDFSVSDGISHFGVASGYAQFDNDGDLTFTGTADYLVPGNRYAFRYLSSAGYGLFFNSTGSQYEFRTADASPVLSVEANSGNLAFDGTATIGSVPKDNALTEVLVKDADGLVHYRDASSLGSGGGLWTQSGSDVYYNTGNVGIGTSNPTSELTVGGEVSASKFKTPGLIMDGSSDKKLNMVTSCINTGGAYLYGDVWGCTNQFDWIRLVRGSSGVKFRVTEDGHTSGASFATPGLTVDGAANNKIYMVSQCIPTGGTYIYGDVWGCLDQFDWIRFERGSTGVKFKVTQEGNGFFAGNVGIGTDNPSTALTVKGTITCAELNVVDVNTIPDYVFKDDYNLMNLEELSNFIEENGHLPNIPNEAQVQKEGLKLAELNLKLLEKIEELTLHLIEKDTQIKHQFNMISNQKAEIAEIREQISQIKTQNSIER